MPDLNKYDVYYLGDKINEIFDYNFNTYSIDGKTGYITLYYINDNGQIATVSGGFNSFEFRKKANE